MGNWSYLSRDNFKTRLADTATTDDVVYRTVLEAVAELIDQELHRTFRTYLATRYYTARYSGRLDLPEGDDLLAITTLKSDPDDDQDYDDTWATTDYQLEPINATVDRRPYYRIRTKRQGTRTFPSSYQGVEIAGKWGFWEDLETSPSTTAEALDATETGVDVTAGSDFDVLDTILVDSEQMYVTAIASNSLTVVRGVNGTTAATHLTGATVQRYRYPAPVVEATGIQAARYFLRKGAPFGVLGSADVGYVRLRPQLDPDVLALLDPYRLALVA